MQVARPSHSSSPETIVQITERLVAFYNPVKIYLFGSVARGDDGRTGRRAARDNPSGRPPAVRIQVMTGRHSPSGLLMPAPFNPKSA